MSSDKYIIKKPAGNYTILLNKVLQKLNNYEALGLYCYLFSLPDEWEFIIRDESDVKQIRESRAKAQAQQIKLQQAEVAAGAAADASSAHKNMREANK